MPVPPLLVPPPHGPEPAGLPLSRRVLRILGVCYRSQEASKSGQEAAKRSFFRLQEPPRALQEASKRLSEGFRVEDAIRIPFWTHFWLQKESLGANKSLKSLQPSLKIKVLLFSALIVFGPRFGTLLGSFWEGIWPPGNAETSLLGGLGPSKSRFQLLFWAPKASKSAPRGIQERPIRPWKPSSGLSSLFKSSKRPPRRLQETSRAHLAAMLVPCWSNFPAHSKRCCRHVGHISSLKAASPRALDPRPKAWRNARERLNSCFMSGKALEATAL